MRYAVFDNEKPARHPDHTVHKSWSNHRFGSLSEAVNYAHNWLGSAGYDGLVLKPNCPVDYSGFGDTIEIRTED